MREDDYRDTLDSVPLKKRTVRRPLQTRVLVRQLEGTFCFDTGEGYECGLGTTLQKGRELTLSGSFGVGVGPVQGSVGVQYTQTVSQTFDHHSERCQTCQLMACRLDAMVRKWSCFHGVGRFGFRHTKSKVLGGRVVYSPRCVVTAACEGCENEVVPVPSAPAEVPEADDPPDALTVEVDSVEDLGRSTTLEFIDEAAALVDSLGETDEADSRNAVFSEVFVVQGRLDPISLTTLHPERPSIAILTEDAADRARNALRFRPGGFIPIIAVAPLLHTPSASARLLMPQSASVPQLEVWSSVDLATRPGRFTTIAGGLEAPLTRVSEVGGEGVLEILLQDNITGLEARRVVPVRLDG